MAKCSVKIGYSRFEEIQPGVWSDEIMDEKKYYGDIITNNRRFDSDSSKIADNLRINNTISIISNRFMLDNMTSMKYIEFKGAKWEISSVNINHPRLFITMGGLYNGPQNRSTQSIINDGH